MASHAVDATVAFSIDSPGGLMTSQATPESTLGGIAQGDAVVGSARVASAAGNILRAAFGVEMAEAEDTAPAQA